MNRVMAERIENVMGAIEKDITSEQNLTLKINRLIDQRNAIQRLINTLEEERTWLEQTKFKGKGDKNV